MQMWRRVFDRHYSDKSLLAYADGEIGRYRRARMKAHLSRCWSCRGRIHDLDNEAQAFARKFTESNFPGPIRTAEAKRKLLTEVRSEDLKFDASVELSSGQQHSPRLAWAVAAAVCCVVLTAGWYTLNRSELAIEQVLERSLQVEWAISGQPVEQVAELEFAGSGQKAGSNKATLHVWSDRSRNRHVSRWRDSGGSLVHAVWRPSRNKAFVYDSSAPGAIEEKEVTTFSAGVNAFIEAGLSVRSLELVLKEMLVSRQWCSVSMVKSAIKGSGEYGLETLVEEIESRSEDTRAMRVTLRQRTSGRSIEFYLAVDRNSYRLLSERVVFRRPGEALELALTPKGTSPLTDEEARRVFSPEWIRASVFDVDFPFPGVTSTRRAAVPTPPRVEKPAPPAEPQPDEIELLRAEIEAGYALHRAGASHGEPVEVVRYPGSHVEVRGLVERAGRKSELIAMLADVSDSPYVKVSIQTMEEVAEKVVEESVPDTEAADVSMAVPQAPAKFEKELRAKLRRTGLRSAEVEGEVTRLFNEAVSVSEDMMADAWAMRRLADSCSPEMTRQLQPNTRWLLEAMLEDHLKGLQSSVRRLRRLLGPALEAELAPVTGPLTGPRESWQVAVLAVFEDVRSLHDQVTAAFAGSGHNAEMDVAELANALRTRFNSLNQEFAVARETLNREMATRAFGSPE